MRAHSCHWSISRYAHNADCADSSFAIVFSASIGAIDWATAEPCSKLNLKSRSTDSMRRGAGRGKPDGPKRLPISLGFKCAHCRNEFDSLHAMDIPCRHSSSFGTPCADPRNHKSMSFTERRWKRRSSCWDSPSTWYPRCVAHSSILLLRKCRLCLQK